VTSWLNPTAILIGALFVVFSPISPPCTSRPTRLRLGKQELELDFRVRASPLASSAGALALAGLLVVRQDSPRPSGTASPTEPASP